MSDWDLSPQVMAAMIAAMPDTELRYIDGWCVIDEGFDSGLMTLAREEADGTMVTKHVMRVDDLFADNAAIRAENTSKGGDMRMVASIPMNIWQRDLAEPTAQGDRQYIKRYLNDVDNDKFRTRDGRI